MKCQPWQHDIHPEALNRHNTEAPGLRRLENEVNSGQKRHSADYVCGCMQGFTGFCFVLFSLRDNQKVNFEGSAQEDLFVYDLAECKMQMETEAAAKM